MTDTNFGALARAVLDCDCLTSDTRSWWQSRLQEWAAQQYKLDDIIDGLADPLRWAKA